MFGIWQEFVKCEICLVFGQEFFKCEICLVFGKARSLVALMACHTQASAAAFLDNQTSS